jgi:hypothetical protein
MSRSFFGQKKHVDEVTRVSFVIQREGQEYLEDLSLYYGKPTSLALEAIIDDFLDHPEYEDPFKDFIKAAKMKAHETGERLTKSGTHTTYVIASKYRSIVEEIGVKHGLFEFSSTLRNLVNFTHSKKFPKKNLKLKEKAQTLLLSQGFNIRNIGFVEGELYIIIKP